MAFLPAAPAATALPSATTAAACRRRPPRTGRGSLAVAAAAAGQEFGGTTAAATAAASTAVVGVVAPLSPHVGPFCFGGSTARPPRGGGSGSGFRSSGSSKSSSSSSSSTTGGSGGGGGGGGAGGAGGGDDEGEDEEERVVVRDVVTGRSLPAVVAHTVVARGTSYAVCAPRDEPVVIATMTVEDGEDVLAPVDDEATLDALFPTAYSVMAENDWTLHRTAFVLTAEDLADDDDDDEEEEEGEATEPATGDHTMAEAAAVAATGNEEDEEVVEGSEQVQVLAEFCVDSVRYYVCTPFEPVVLVARTAQGAGGDGILVVPDEAELAAVTPVIEDALEAQAELL